VISVAYVPPSGQAATSLETVQAQLQHTLGLPGFHKFTFTNKPDRVMVCVSE